MRPWPRLSIWMSAAVIGALMLAALAIIIKGPSVSGVSIGLRLTARFSYVFFWLAYVGGALATLFGPTFRGVARRRREFGLAFASAQLVHVGLVVWIAFLSPPEQLSQSVMPFFAIAIVWTYLLAALSTDRARRLIGPHLLRALFTIGSEYIALTYFTDFVISPKYPIQYPLLYIPFWAMLLLGPLLRIAAAGRKIGARMLVAPG